MIEIIKGIVSIIKDIFSIVRDAKPKTQDSNLSSNRKPIKRFSIKVVKTAVNDVVKQIENDHYVPSIIIGIGRGGGIWGSFVSYKLYHTPVFVVDREYDWKTRERKLNILFDFEIPAYYMDRILLVAGEAHTGETIKCFEDYLKENGAGVIKTCVFYKQTVCRAKIDYCYEEGESTPLMPWQDKENIRDSISEDSSNELIEWRQKIDKMGDKMIFVVRHGETDHNKNDVFIGTTPSPLNTTGEQQIEKLANYLNKNECLRSNNTIILSSDQDRGLQTSTIIGQKLGIGVSNIIQCAELRERDYGSWEGKSRQQIKKNHGSDYKKYEKDPLHFSPIGAEKLTDVIGRTQCFIDLITNNNTDNIVIVTHKTTGRLLLSYFTRSCYSKYRELEFNNGSLTKFTMHKGEIKTDYINRTNF